MNEYQPSPVNPPNFSPLNFDDLYRDARTHRPDLVWNYAIKGWLRRAETSVLFGPSNCGKSALVCYLGNCIVTGTPCFDARVRQGIVVHVGAEAPASVLDRMQAYDLGNVPTAAPYIVRMEPVNLSEPTQVDQFVAELRRLRQDFGEEVILIVFDTLARSIGAVDENCASTMTGVANAAERIARQINAHVMLVHHTGKDADRGGRGSSALRGAVDTEISLTPLKGAVVRVAQEKQRTMPKADASFFQTKSFVLGLDEDGEDRTTVMSVECQKPSEKEDDGKSALASKYDTAVLSCVFARRRGSGHFRVRAHEYGHRFRTNALLEQVLQPLAEISALLRRSLEHGHCWSRPVKNGCHAGSSILLTSSLQQPGWQQLIRLRSNLMRCPVIHLQTAGTSLDIDADGFPGKR